MFVRFSQQAAHSVNPHLDPIYLVANQILDRLEAAGIEWVFRDGNQLAWEMCAGVWNFVLIPVNPCSDAELEIRVCFSVKTGEIKKVSFSFGDLCVSEAQLVQIIHILLQPQTAE